MKNTQFTDRVDAVRAFSRFYTRKAGVLNEMLLSSNFALTEARVMYELNHRPQTTAKALATDLELDQAYVSRLIKKIEKLGYISRESSKTDRRSQIIELTSKGREEAAILDQKSVQLFGNLIKPLASEQQGELLAAMDRIRALLDQPDKVPAPYLLRPHRPGDMGWIVQCHGRLYSEEYGFDETFEALVAEIAAEFLKKYDKASECCWIAEMDGKNVGSAMVVRADTDTAKLRLVIVDPNARGYGIGHKLVEECLNFARRSGYKSMSLWTQSNLTAAIAIYKKHGFTLAEEEPHHSFGKDLVGQYWTRNL
ncbi:MAG: helix-turn-helix domain-containing GNAT family N-acetyltransferase [Sneathiella sp.]